MIMSNLIKLQYKWNELPIEYLPRIIHTICVLFFWYWPIHQNYIYFTEAWASIRLPMYRWNNHKNHTDKLITVGYTEPWYAPYNKANICIFDKVYCTTI